jgi:hypothetical protein
MQAQKEKRFYTPQFSQMATVTVRRLAWAFDISMPKAVDLIITKLSSIFSPSVICQQCEDKTKCTLCGFKQPTVADISAEKAGTENAA